MTPLLKTAMMPYGMAYAIEPGAARQIRAALRGVDMAAHIRETQALRIGLPGNDDEAPGYEMEGSVAMLNLSGPLTKQVSSFQAMLGGTGTVQFCADMAAAGADPAALSIVIVIDSPGGSVDGTEELYQCIRDAAAKKPVYAYTPDLCASAAYYAACGASAHYASAAALVGSIGCYTVLEDSSKAAEMAGTEVVVIGDGEMKGAGVDGTPLTAAQKADILRVVKDRNANFVAAVSKGRQMPIGEARAVADGRVHVGAKAEALNLTDGTLRLSDLMAKIQADPSSLVPERSLHPNARLGNRNAQRNSSRAQENSMSKSLIAGALARLNLHKMSGKVMAASDDDPEAQAQAMAGEMDAEVTARVADRETNHPLLSALAAAGITIVPQLDALLNDAAAGRAAVAKIRTDAKANAVIAFGQEAGAAEASAIDALPAGPALDRYAAHMKAEALKKAPAEGKTPQTLGTQTKGVIFAQVAGDGEKQPDLVAAHLAKKNGAAK